MNSVGNCLQITFHSFPVFLFSVDAFGILGLALSFLLYRYVSGPCGACSLLRLVVGSIELSQASVILNFGSWRFDFSEEGGFRRN